MTKHLTFNLFHLFQKVPLNKIQNPNHENNNECWIAVSIVALTFIFYFIFLDMRTVCDDYSFEIFIAALQFWLIQCKGCPSSFRMVAYYNESKINLACVSALLSLCLMQKGLFSTFCMMRQLSYNVWHHKREEKKKLQWKREYISN